MSQSSRFGDRPRVTRRIAALVLAAGSSRRMGSRNKLLIEIAGAPLVSHTVDAVVNSNATHVLVVTGYQRSGLERALRGKRIRFVHNPDYRNGLSSSLRRGLDALPLDFRAVLVCLGDMPLVTSADINRLIAVFRRVPHPTVCVSSFAGRHGNPVIFPSTLRCELAGLQGDSGAQQWMARHSSRICRVAMNTDAVLTDIDAPMSLHRLRYRLPPSPSQNGAAKWTTQNH